MFNPDYSSIIWGLSPIILTVGLVYHVISFSWPHWLENKDCYLGLWRHSCENSSLYDTLSRDMDSMNSSYTATRVFEVLALLCVMTCVLSGLLRVNSSRVIFQKVCALSGSLGGIFSLIGCLVFCFAQRHPVSLSLSWAFVLNVVSGCFCLFASPVLYIDLMWHK